MSQITRLIQDEEKITEAITKTELTDKELSVLCARVLRMEAHLKVMEKAFDSLQFNVQIALRNSIPSLKKKKLAAA